MVGEEVVELLPMVVPEVVVELLPMVVPEVVVPPVVVPNNGTEVIIIITVTVVTIGTKNLTNTKQIHIQYITFTYQPQDTLGYNAPNCLVLQCEHQ